MKITSVLSWEKDVVIGEFVGCCDSGFLYSCSDWFVDGLVGEHASCCSCSLFSLQDDAACQSWLQRHMATTDGTTRIIPLPSARKSDTVLTLASVMTSRSSVRSSVHTFDVSDAIFLISVTY